ncbi:MAG TPA: YibE/F family protein [Candidatus Nanoarchaeia archaeon]|nr:YibE/F family protein [Candidatus Nanoarchaeia archaeon]
MKYLLSIFVFCALFPNLLLAQNGEIIIDQVETVKAKVIEVLAEETKAIPGTDITSNFQEIKVQILEGAQKDKIVEVENDYLNLDEGEIFYLIRTTNSVDGKDYYSVSEPYRLPVVLLSVILFIILVFVFGGIQGIRGLASLVGSLVLILYVLLPGILHGFSPVIMSLFVSSLIIIIGSYITHGFNKTTSSAVIGMIATVFITGFLAYIAVHFGRLTGFSDDEAVYLNLDTRGSIDFVGLLLGGMLIGLLGVLYDVAIGQAISVEELHHVAPHLSRKTIYKRATRIGREHIGALVNTLAIAYVGVSLPLLLLYVKSVDAPLGLTLNKEIFATEIIRTMIGSIGLVLAVPITTLISVWILMKVNRSEVTPEKLAQEEKEIEHLGYHHH